MLVKNDECLYYKKNFSFVNVCVFVCVAVGV